MGVRSLGNALASFGYKFGTTGIELMLFPHHHPFLQLVESLVIMKILEHIIDLTFLHHLVLL